MKRLLILILGIAAIGSLSAQNLDNIIRKHLEAVNAEQRSRFKSLFIKGSINMQGMVLNMEMYEKVPDKLKSVSTYNGMEIVQVINGDRGYMINPLMGSPEAVPLSSDQIASVKINSMLNTNIKSYYSEGKMELAGEEPVSGSPAFRIKITAPEGTRYIFIDKESYYITQVRLTVNQMGNDINIDLRMSDFDTFDGVIVARTTHTFMNGQPAGTAKYETIEFNREIDDSVFEIK